jgi:FixJ family two-component response regulator
MPSRISIIDDDDAVREATKGLLPSLGYMAAAFASAEAFVNSEEIAKTSCVISDIRMPGMGGVALHARLSEEGYKLPFIFITAFPDETTKKRVLAAGARGYLLKPYQEGNLIRCIETALHS